MAHHHYCATILENPCEESRLQSHRNHEELPSNRALPTLELDNHTLYSDCTSIDRADLSDPSRSISLLEQLRRDASNQKQCNLPRQIKSMFSCDSHQERCRKAPPLHEEEQSENLTKKEYDAIMASKTLKYDLPRGDRCPLSGFSQKQQNQTEQRPKKSLKESIYERLMEAKRDKDKIRFESKRGHQSIKEATFRPSKGKGKAHNNPVKPSQLNTVCKLKELIKNKIMGNPLKPTETAKPAPKKAYAEFFLDIDMTEEEMSPPTTRPNYLTKYESILKENINTGNCSLSKTNKLRSCKQEASIPQAKHQSFMQSLKLRQSLMQPLAPADSSRQVTNQPTTQQPLAKARSMTSLTFQQRQRRTLDNRSDKVVKHSMEKQRDELKGCTFRPQLTPYRGFPAEVQRWSSYAELHKRKAAGRPH